jgi:hypothetical protein
VNTPSKSEHRFIHLFFYDFSTVKILNRKIKPQNFLTVCPLNRRKLPSGDHKQHENAGKTKAHRFIVFPLALAHSLGFLLWKPLSNNQ